MAYASWRSVQEELAVEGEVEPEVSGVVEWSRYASLWVGEVE